MKLLWSTRFEIRPGRWVFVPTAEAREHGEIIKNKILEKWKPPSYMYQFQSGAHLAAAQLHVNNRWFTKIDLRNFYGSINRSRATRSLKSLFPYKDARLITHLSVVRAPRPSSNWILPYGFVQSPSIAALCFSKSALGIYVNSLAHRDDICVSVYVDDIVVSAKYESKLRVIFDKLLKMTTYSGFEINDKKTQPPKNVIVTFNLKLSHNRLLIEYERFLQLKEKYVESTSLYQKNGIYNYVASVNELQAYYL